VAAAAAAVLQQVSDDEIALHLCGAVRFHSRQTKAAAIIYRGGGKGGGGRSRLRGLIRLKLNEVFVLDV
jgi:hypothetical protein